MYEEAFDERADAWGRASMVGDTGGNNPHPVPRAQYAIIIIAAQPHQFLP